MDLEMLSMMMGRSGLNAPPNGGRRPKFVKLIPGDVGGGLPESIFEDPRTFKGKPNALGQVHAWGLYPYDNEYNFPQADGMANMMRQMNFQFKYGRDLPSPEHQFVDVLIDRKAKQLSTVDLKGLDKRDVILRITMPWMNDAEGKPRVWRRFRVSAGIKLGVLQDKVIAPVMGWVRNFHCYTFTDFRDGSLFGPQNSRSIDSMHIAQSGYKYMPDDKYMLAHLFEKEGDKIGYLYDFGDMWIHTIEVETILPLEESDGHIEIIDGHGMCPAENMNGNNQYADFLKGLEAASGREKLEEKRKILQSPNYSDYKVPASAFDHTKFDLKLATTRLNAALASSKSVPSGAKVYNMPFHPDAAQMSQARDQPSLRKGQSVEQKFDESGGYWQETTSNARDRRGESVCAACGKPAGKELKACSGCKKVLYCSQAHQLEHWKKAHKKQCSRQYLKPASGVSK
ncbi:hypothetical protein JAAARDRAFT_67997 [Jaapia argillacea MUCL 33604]|uniref:MYND-type domain-containing protein n=1 Tax=Jaapia argillacea MUCL 33604 TaxID=933084 RepID=A0A067Q078_9AGAM|nr:hypothetical protein JAAARDRAFT_67997 [Jaapia argillacea MUCL 33604]